MVAEIKIKDYYCTSGLYTQVHLHYFALRKQKRRSPFKYALLIS